MRLLFVFLFVAVGAAAQQPSSKIISLDPSFDKLVPATAKMEILAEGLKWTEGPVWIKDSSYLLFSDVKQNTVFKWKDGEGLSIFLQPSGYTGRLPYSKEPGSNGLTINKDGQLISCEHGDRRISSMPLSGGGKQTLAESYNGKRLNSPNDIIQGKTGDYYFTDPAYGLPEAAAAQPMGLYRLSPAGKVTLIATYPAPNGVAISPDGKILYLAQSHGDKAIIDAYPINADGSVGKSRLLYDATALSKQGLRGSPDGLKTDLQGNIFSSGPGGIIVINPAGKLIGRIETGDLTSNCAWGDDGGTLYMTVNSRLCRIKLSTRGF